MKVAVLYCYPQVRPQLHFPMAEAFAVSWRQNDPGYPCQLVVGCNGMGGDERAMRPFAGLGHQTIVHDNTGWDVGLYLRACDELVCDFLVCLGAHIRLQYPGWLKRLVDAVLVYGAGLYGPWGAQYPTWHIRTTAFAAPPELIGSYPFPVDSTRFSRYRFEHGGKSLTRHALDAGFPVVMVTMKGNFPWPDWPAHVPTPAESILLDKQHR